ncbi:MAG TPA: SDR family oxidoreductase [Thermoanaerobaculia bacterium]|jgi:3-oxoacyl-[acyl-carrier protein] reductase|nr:SDR family oxidoreductase [Thermoanaerobaculia bacterium]
MAELKGKKAFVTGGSRGIGAAIVRRLARDHADVAFTYHERKDAADEVAADVKRLGRKTLAIRADSGDPGALSDAVARAAKEFGQIDIFVSSAGVLVFKPIDEFTIEDFDRVVAVDLRAAFVGSKAALAYMGEGGRIIFIASNIADYAALPTTGFYAMVKSGLDGLCKGMARDLGPRGITVNTVHPGPIATDANPEDGQYGDDLKRFMATPKFGTGDDVAGLVAYLVSSDASFANGAAYKIDNGFTA